jgi:glutamate synthase domain-containing protein 3
LHAIIENHLRATGSERAEALLADWYGALDRFRRYAPAEMPLNGEARPTLETRPQVPSP